jgi:hypothetical protein
MRIIPPDSDRLSIPVRRLAVGDYNAVRVRAALAAWADRPAAPVWDAAGPCDPVAWGSTDGIAWEARGRNGNGGGAREIQGPPKRLSGTRLNIGDSEGVSVTPGPGSTRRGGRPRRYASDAEGNRARQRRYRARRAPHGVPDGR